MFGLTQDKATKILAIYVTFMICISRVYIPAGWFASQIIALFGILLWIKFKNSISISDEIKGYMKAYAVLVICTVPSVIISDNLYISVNDFFNMWIWPYVAFAVIVVFIRRRDYVVDMLTAFLLFSGVDGLYTLIQLVTNTATDNRGYGLGGWLLTIADIMCMLLPIALVILMDQRFDKKLKKASAFAVAGILTGLLCNKSRGAWLTELIVVPIAVFRYLKENKKFLTIFITIVIGIFVYMASNPKYVQRIQSITNITTDHSNADRIWAWKSAKLMVQDHPIAGVGLGRFYDIYINQYKYEQETQSLVHAHNNFIHITVENGIIGLAGLIYFVGFYLYTSMQNYRRNRNPYDILIFTTFLAHVCLFGQIDYTMWSWAGMQPIFWFLLALLLKLKETDEQFIKAKPL